MKALLWILVVVVGMYGIFVAIDITTGVNIPRELGQMIHSAKH